MPQEMEQALNPITPKMTNFKCGRYLDKKVFCFFFVLLVVYQENGCVVWTSDPKMTELVGPVLLKKLTSQT